MKITSESIVGQIVRFNFNTARIFEKNNIDFCCGGDISLLDAAKREGLDEKELLSAIHSVMDKADRDAAYIESLSLSGLVDYIIKIHHSYVNENIPFLLQKLEKLSSVHGANHPEIDEVKALFEETAGNLSAHMNKEELVLFPYIRSMEESVEKKTKLSQNPGMAGSAIKVMKAEHQSEGDRFARISEITNDYSIPDDACNTYEVTYKTLKAFEQDLHRHIHLENNILFPKALALETQLLKNIKPDVI